MLGGLLAVAVHPCPAQVHTLPGLSPWESWRHLLMGTEAGSPGRAGVSDFTWRQLFLPLSFGQLGSFGAQGSTLLSIPIFAYTEASPVRDRQAGYGTAGHVMDRNSGENFSSGSKTGRDRQVRRDIQFPHTSPWRSWGPRPNHRTLAPVPRASGILTVSL